MKKTLIPTFILFMILSAITASAEHGGYRGFERHENKRFVEGRGVYRGYNNYGRVVYGNTYNRGYYYNRPRVIYNPVPVYRNVGYSYQGGMGYQAGVYLNPAPRYVYPYRSVRLSPVLYGRHEVFAHNESLRRMERRRF